jgi:hypothetical protein
MTKTITKAIVLLTIAAGLAGCAKSETVRPDEQPAETETVATEVAEEKSAEDIKQIIIAHESNHPTLALGVYFNNKVYDGNTRLYGEADLTPPDYLATALQTAMMDWKRILRNEIFSRNGYHLSDRVLLAVFSGCEWYNPVENSAEVVFRKMNDIERKNLNFLRESEVAQAKQRVPSNLPPDVEINVNPDGSIQYAKIGAITNLSGDIVSYRLVSSSADRITSMKFQEEYNRSVGVSQKDIEDAYYRKRGEGPGSEAYERRLKTAEFKKKVSDMFNKYENVDFTTLSDTELNRIIEEVDPHKHHYADTYYDLDFAVLNPQYCLYVMAIRALAFNRAKREGKVIHRVVDNIGYKMKRFEFPIHNHFKVYAEPGYSGITSPEIFLRLIYFKDNGNYCFVQGIDSRDKKNWASRGVPRLRKLMDLYTGKWYDIPEGQKIRIPNSLLYEGIDKYYRNLELKMGKWTLEIIEGKAPYEYKGYRWEFSIIKKDTKEVLFEYEGIFGGCIIDPSTFDIYIIKEEAEKMVLYYYYLPPETRKEFLDKYQIKEALNEIKYWDY